MVDSLHGDTAYVLSALRGPLAPVFINAFPTLSRPVRVSDVHTICSAAGLKFGSATSLGPRPSSAGSTLKTMLSASLHQHRVLNDTLHASRDFTHSVGRIEPIYIL